MVAGEISVADKDTNLKMVEANKEITHAFRFDTSDKCLRLTQQQLDCIPYLSALVTHKDDFSSTENEDNEFVVDPSINYNWFMVIFDSIIANQYEKQYLSMDEVNLTRDYSTTYLFFLFILYSYLSLRSDKHSFTEPI